VHAALCCAELCCAVRAALWQDILDGRGQADFEAANPLPESFMNGTRAMMATFITTGCDTVRPLLRFASTWAGILVEARLSSCAFALCAACMSSAALCPCSIQGVASLIIA